MTPFLQGELTAAESDPASARFRVIPVPLERTVSYGAGTEAGEVRLLRDVDTDVAGRDVLLIDDILESGNTLKYTRDLMLSRGARKVGIAVLLDKSMKRKADLTADYTGFECPDQFVVGYGMDVAHAFRELPFVGVVTGDA